jgi:hypothetical protein
VQGYFITSLFPLPPGLDRQGRQRELPSLREGREQSFRVQSYSFHYKLISISSGIRHTGEYKEKCPPLKKVKSKAESWKNLKI